MQQGSRIVLNRQQLRETILMDRLSQLWNQNKVVYILMLLGLFVIAVLTILYVLETVVVPSSRYSFLEKVQAVRFQKYLALRRFENSLLKSNGKVVHSPVQPTPDYHPFVSLKSPTSPHHLAPTNHIEAQQARKALVSHNSTSAAPSHQTQRLYNAKQKQIKKLSKLYHKMLRKTRPTKNH